MDPDWLDRTAVAGTMAMEFAQELKRRVRGHLPLTVSAADAADILGISLLDLEMWMLAVGYTDRDVDLRVMARYACYVSAADVVRQAGVAGVLCTTPRYSLHDMYGTRLTGTTCPERLKELGAIVGLQAVHLYDAVRRLRRYSGSRGLKWGKNQEAIPTLQTLTMLEKLYRTV